MLYDDAKKIIDTVLKKAQPGEAVARALNSYEFSSGRIVLIAIGKAAWQMASAAGKILAGRIDSGVVITKYGHSMGDIQGLDIYEAGHPVPDENSFAATGEAISAIENLSGKDTVLFLVSGGGSALFEKPLVEFSVLEDITKQLLASGADIVEMNTIRKRLSAVKGGRFAQLCAPANVFSIVLSDIIGDPLDMIASGPAYPDSSTVDQAKAIISKYGIKTDGQVDELLRNETPKTLSGVKTVVTGSVSQLCETAKEECLKLGYDPYILTDSLCCTARDAGSFLASIAQHHRKSGRQLAFIAGGETVVRLTGKGKGGRNQELALSAAAGISGLEGVAIFSLGSDGTDGPTDAAGGYVDSSTMKQLEAKGMDLFSYLNSNDSYNALNAVGGLLITGPTGTNVNDLSVVLIRPF